MIKKKKRAVRKNNGVFYVVISLVAVLGVASLVSAYALSNNIQVDGDLNIENYNEAVQPAPAEVNLSAAAGPDQYQRSHFYGSLITGGTSLATSSDVAAITWAKKDLPDELSTIIHTANLDTTVTTPTDYQLVDWLGLTQAGDSRVIYFQNASSSAAASITFAAGAGVDLQYDEDSADLAVVGLDWAKLTFLRRGTSASTTVFLTEFTEAD